MKTNKFKAAILTVLAAGALSAAACLVKLAAPLTATNFIAFVRFGFSAIYIVIFINIQRMAMQKTTSPHSIKIVIFPPSSHLRYHLIRAISGTSAILLYYYALAYIPLVNVTLLFMTNALFVPVFSHFFLDIHLTLKMWLSLCLAFIGVTLVLHPGIGSFHTASLVALASGAASAISFITVRESVKYDPPHTSMAYFNVIAFLFCAVLLIFHWPMPTFYVMTLLTGVGIFGIFYQECLTRATQYASAHLVTALMYSSVLFSGLFDWLIWHKVLNLLGLIGCVIVIFSTLLLLFYSSE